MPIVGDGAAYARSTIPIIGPPVPCHLGEFFKSIASFWSKMLRSAIVHLNCLFRVSRPKYTSQELPVLNRPRGPVPQELFEMSNIQFKCATDCNFSSRSPPGAKKAPTISCSAFKLDIKKNQRLAGLSFNIFKDIFRIKSPWCGVRCLT